jgi:hypothetical protein
MTWPSEDLAVSDTLPTRAPSSRRTREAQQVAGLRQQARVQQQAQQLGVPRRPQVRCAVRLGGGDVALHQRQYAQRRLMAARLPCSTVSRLTR